MPPADFFSSSMRLTMTRSCNGRIFISVSRSKTYELQWVVRYANRFCGLVSGVRGNALETISTQSRRVLIIAAMRRYFKSLLRLLLGCAALALSGPALAGAAALRGPVLKELKAAGIPPSSAAAIVGEGGAGGPSLSGRPNASMNPACVRKCVPAFAGAKLSGPGGPCTLLLYPVVVDHV